MPENKILEEVEDGWILYDIPYFALCEKKFKKYV